MRQDEIARRVTGLLEVDTGLALGALSASGRGKRETIFARYLAAHIMVTYFEMNVDVVAKLLGKDRGTVTKALKVFRFLEGYQGWRQALSTISELCARFVAYGLERERAAEHVPPPVGRVRRNDTLPQWARDRYAIEIEAVGDAESAREARAQAEADKVFLRHPAVKAITDDPGLIQILGELVVSVTLSPLDDNCGRPLLLVPPDEKSDGAIALRLMMKGDSPPEIKRMLDARARIARTLVTHGYRLTGVAETFASRDRDGWRYAPLHIAQVR